MSIKDLPDYTDLIVVNVDVPPAQQMPMIPRPMGGIKEEANATSTDTYADIVTHTVTNAKTFQLSKIVVSVEKATWVKLQWNSADISCERLLDDKTTLLEHFPWDYHTMEGDGAKAISIQAKYESEAGDVQAEIVGEEVTT